VLNWCEIIYALLVGDTEEMRGSESGNDVAERFAVAEMT